MTLEDWVLGFLNPREAVSMSIKLFANNVLCTMIADMESSSPPPYILGRKIVVVNSPDACQFVLSTGHMSFTTNDQNHVSRLLSNRKIVRPRAPTLPRDCVLGHDRRSSAEQASFHRCHIHEQPSAAASGEGDESHQAPAGKGGKADCPPQPGSHRFVAFR